MDRTWGTLGGASPQGMRERQPTVFGRALGGQPVLSRTVSEQVHRFIQHALLSGQLNPGDRLAEGELAAALGISRTPIREALRQLSNDGLVVVLPHRGTFVRTLDPLRGRQLHEARLLLEPATARAAAARITDRQLEQLRPLLDSALNEAEAGDMGGASVDSEASPMSPASASFRAESSSGRSCSSCRSVMRAAAARAVAGASSSRASCSWRPRSGSTTTSPSLLSWRRASLIGVRDIPSAAASSPSASRSPGLSWPESRACWMKRCTCSETVLDSTGWPPRARPKTVGCRSRIPCGEAPPNVPHVRSMP